MPSLVECRSEYQYAQRPVAFLWQNERLLVKAILTSWRTPEALGFRVQTGDGHIFELLYIETQDAWEIRPS